MLKLRWSANMNDNTQNHNLHFYDHINLNRRFFSNDTFCQAALQENSVQNA